MADCKRIAKGLRSDRMWDVDLWGHEKPPTLQQKLNQFRGECNHIKRSIELLPNASLLDVHDNLKYLLQLITYKIRDVREIENVERKRLLIYEKLNPDPNYKSSAKGACRAHIYDCKMFINNALELNQSLCKYISLLQKTSCMFNTVRVQLQDQPKLSATTSTQLCCSTCYSYSASRLVPTAFPPMEKSAHSGTHHW